MLSLRELERAVRILDGALRGARLDKLVQLDAHRLVLSFRDETAPGGRRHVLLCCEPASPRLSQLRERPAAPRTPPPFVQRLRKQLGRATCTGLRILAGDRQAAVGLRSREAEFDLLLSILGPRSNVYLIDARGILRASLRPLAKTRRALALGEPWRHPETPAPGPGTDRWAAVADDAFFDAMEGHYGALEGREREQELVRRLSHAFDKEAAALERKLAALHRDLETARGAQRDQRRGELLKGVLDRVRRGATEIEVEDWETGERVAIPLDPTLSPRANLEALFKRYRKRLRAREHLARQLGVIQQRLDEQGALAEEFRALAGADPPDAGALEAFAARPAPRRLLARYHPVRPPARRRASRIAGREVPARLVPRRYRSAGGLEIWVGRSDEGNDFLTTRLARGNDLFVHLDGSPGSHVVLRTKGRSDPPAEALLDAAELAVHFSKQRNAPRADVHVVPVKNVSKPKRAKPGLVLATGGRTVHLRRDAERLERVLAARIEDSPEA